MNLSVLHKPFRAFTLLEVLVGMILSGIVLTATFSAYRIITRQYEIYRVKSEAIAEFSFFVCQLQSDFTNATTIIRSSENTIQLNSDKKNLEYTFSEKYVLRNDYLRTDTFHISVPEIETFLKTEKMDPDKEEFDELHLHIVFENNKTEKIYMKSPDAKSTINKIETDLN